MTFPDIFQVEDDDDFAFFMTCAISQLDKSLSIRITTNANDAMKALKQYSEADSKPKLMLLDIDLPGISGIELLKKIREMRHFDNVPIVVFSTSDNPKDSKTSMEWGASAYRIKPIGYTKLVDCLRTITNEWLLN